MREKGIERERERNGENKRVERNIERVFSPGCLLRGAVLNSGQPPSPPQHPRRAGVSVSKDPGTKWGAGRGYVETTGLSQGPPWTKPQSIRGAWLHQRGCSPREV